MGGSGLRAEEILAPWQTTAEPVFSLPMMQQSLADRYIS
jgi:hypothetical protein